MRMKAAAVEYMGTAVLPLLVCGAVDEADEAHLVTYSSPGIAFAPVHVMRGDVMGPTTQRLPVFVCVCVCV